MIDTAHQGEGDEEMVSGCDVRCERTFRKKVLIQEEKVPIPSFIGQNFGKKVSSIFGLSVGQKRSLLQRLNFGIHDQ